MNATSLVHGLIAGCTAAYLKEPTKQTKLTLALGLRDDGTVDELPIPVEVKQRSYTQITLQANHLLLLTAETIHFAGSPLGAFGTVVKIACALTPAAALYTDLTSKKESISQERLDQISTIYQVGVVMTSLATLALGNPVFALASLSVLALDAVASGKGEYILSVAKKVGACLALIGYGAQAFAAEGVLAGLTAISTAVVGLYSLPETGFLPASYVNCYSNPHWDRYDTYKYRSEENGYKPLTPTSNNSFSYLASQIGNSLCRKSVFA